MRFLLFHNNIIFCTYDEIDLCSTQEPSFSECVKPIIEQNCVTCHRNNIKMDYYKLMKRLTVYGQWKAFR